MTKRSEWTNAESGKADDTNSQRASAKDVLVLISGDDLDPGHADRIERVMRCADIRIVGDEPLASLPTRLKQQGRLDILWLSSNDRISADHAACIAEHMERLGATIICEMNGAALDSAYADFAHLPGAQFLTSPDAVDCEMAVAAARGVRRYAVADSGSSMALERIDRLQEEVARITAVLGAMAEREIGYGGRSGPISFSPLVRSGDRAFRPEPELTPFGLAAPPQVDSAMVRRILRQRRMREQFFPAEMFADPAWDMLLDLYAAKLEGHPVAVSSLCIGAAVPATTALRWIKTMTDAGLFERQADPRDGRRIFIALAPQAATGMDRYFAAIMAMRD